MSQTPTEAFEAYVYDRAAAMIGRAGERAAKRPGEMPYMAVDKEITTAQQAYNQAMS